MGLAGSGPTPVKCYNDRPARVVHTLSNVLSSPLLRVSVWCVMAMAMAMAMTMVMMLIVVVIVVVIVVCLCVSVCVCVFVCVCVWGVRVGRHASPVRGRGVGV